MESTFTTSTHENTWEIVPSNTIVGIILSALFFYFMIRHMLLGLMVMDIFLGWLRKFRWFPKEGKRRKAVVHWIIAAGLLSAFLAVARIAGWLEFVAQ
ncbi:hypothetical protein [Sulfitobacter sp. JB4-11]|uniref:hypothetical protein n=1 Tax=Sulfitobacter rhodophyticola TaxID=3238304 RepID=UPI0035151099